MDIHVRYCGGANRASTFRGAVMPLYSSSAVSTATPVGALGLLATTPSNVTTGYSWGYAITNKNLPTYTPNPQSAPYTGVPAALLNAATATELNLLRVAYENLRVMTESLAQQHNAISISLAQAGLIST